MVNRNTNIGGSNWVDGEIMYASDTNDTFNGMYNEVVSVPAFWLNGSFHTVYDDFTGYTAGSIGSSAKWDFQNLSTAGSVMGEFKIISGTQATGVNGALLYVSGNYLSSSPNTAPIYAIASLNMTANKHKHARLEYSVANSTDGVEQGYFSVRVGSTMDWKIFVSGPNSNGAVFNNFPNDFLVQALGSDNYDMYIGGKNVGSAYGETNPQLHIRSTGSLADTWLYVAKVVESVGSVI